MIDCIGNVLGKTPSGDVFIMQAFSDGKVSIEILKYQAVFEPQMIIHDGQIAFSGEYTYRGMAHEIIIYGNNDTVRLFEKARSMVN